MEGVIYIWREICVSKSIGLVKSWKEIYVNNLQKVVAKTRLEDVELQLCKPRESELRKQQYTVTRLQSFGSRRSSLVNAKICVLLYSFCLVIF